MDEILMQSKHTATSAPVGRTLLSAVMMPCTLGLKVSLHPFVSQQPELEDMSIVYFNFVKYLFGQNIHVLIATLRKAT